MESANAIHLTQCPFSPCQNSLQYPVYILLVHSLNSAVPEPHELLALHSGHTVWVGGIATLLSPIARHRKADFEV